MQQRRRDSSLSPANELKRPQAKTSLPQRWHQEDSRGKEEPASITPTTPDHSPIPAPKNEWTLVSPKSKRSPKSNRAKVDYPAAKIAAKKAAESFRQKNYLVAIFHNLMALQHNPQNAQYLGNTINCIKYACQLGNQAEQWVINAKINVLKHIESYPKIKSRLRVYQQEELQSW